MKEELDDLDKKILNELQVHCKESLSKIGKKVGLTAPSVVERIKKLEERGIIKKYVAILDAQKAGKLVTAFIGVTISHPRHIDNFEKEVDKLLEVMECHHVTGEHTLMLKVKLDNTPALEKLISKLRSIRGVTRTNSTVALSTQTERTRIHLDEENTDNFSKHSIKVKKHP